MPVEERKMNLLGYNIWISFLRFLGRRDLCRVNTPDKTISRWRGIIACKILLTLFLDFYVTIFDLRKLLVNLCLFDLGGSTS